MNKKERISKGYVGKVKFLNTRTNRWEESTYDPGENDWNFMVPLNPGELDIISERNRKMMEKDFTGFTEEEERYYSEHIHEYKEDDDETSNT